VIGILFGLGAAFSQSIAYLLSRVYVQRREQSVVDLMVASHLFMGVAALGLLVVVWPPGMPPLQRYLWPALGTAGFYVVGQYGFFRVVRRVEASRAAPLLALKIPTLAALTALLQQGAPQGAWQWSAVALFVGGAFLLNRAGRALDGKSMGWFALTLGGYCLSDLSIVQLVKSLEPLSLTRAAVVGAAVSYILCGVAALAAMPFVSDRASRREWLHAVPYATTWFVGMLCLFACFATVGIVFGNILQSTRGVMSVALAAVLVRRGWLHLEEPVSRTMFWRRVVGASLMTLAIVVFYHGK
jgi:drug/metabolite transporter (DMT)-like permease